MPAAALANEFDQFDPLPVAVDDLIPKKDELPVDVTDLIPKRDTLPVDVSDLIPKPAGSPEYQQALAATQAAQEALMGPGSIVGGTLLAGRLNAEERLRKEAAEPLIKKELPYPENLQPGVPQEFSEPDTTSPLKDQLSAIAANVTGHMASTGLGTAAGYEYAKAKGIHDAGSAVQAARGLGLPDNAFETPAYELAQTKTAEERAKSFSIDAQERGEPIAPGAVTSIVRGLTGGLEMAAIAKVGGIPLMALQGATHAYGQSKGAGATDADAETAAAHSLIGLALFGASNAAVARGISAYLGAGAKPLNTFLVQALGQSAGNEVTSRAIAAGEAAEAAPAGQKVEKALEALKASNLETTATNIGFGLHGALGAAAHTAAELAKSSIPTSGVSAGSTKPSTPAIVGDIPIRDRLGAIDSQLAQFEQKLGPREMFNHETQRPEQARILDHRETELLKLRDELQSKLPPLPAPIAEAVATGRAAAQAASTASPAAAAELSKIMDAIEAATARKAAEPPPLPKPAAVEPPAKMGESAPPIAETGKAPAEETSAPKVEPPVSEPPSPSREPTTGRKAFETLLAEEPTKPESATPKVVGPALVDRDGTPIAKGEAGQSHAELKAAEIRTGNTDAADAEHAFHDEAGNILTRRQAADAALKAGQIDQATHDRAMARAGEPGLHSEDLSPDVLTKDVKPAAPLEERIRSPKESLSDEEIAGLSKAQRKERADTLKAAQFDAQGTVNKWTRVQDKRKLDRNERRALARAEAARDIAATGLSDLERVPPSAKPKSLNVTPADTGDTFQEDPVVRVVMDHGGLLSKTQAKNQWSAEKFDADKGVWDDAPGKMAHPTHNAIYKPGGLRPDEMLGAVIDAGLLPPDAQVTDLWKKIGDASIGGKNARNQAVGFKAEEKQMRSFERAAMEPKEGGTATPVEDLKVGDEVEVDGERMIVTDVDTDSGTVTMKDGSKFGRRVVEDGRIIYGELKSGPDTTLDDWPEIDTPEKTAEHAAKEGLTEDEEKPATPARPPEEQPAPADAEGHEGALPPAKDGGRDAAYERAWALAERIGEQVTKGQRSSITEAAIQAAFDNARSSIEGSPTFQFNRNFMEKSARSAAAREAVKRGRETSLDAPIEEGGDVTGHEELGAEQASPADIAAAKDDVERAALMLKGLDPREQEIVTRWMHRETFEEIAADLGISRQRVQAIHAEALDKMRKRLAESEVAAPKTSAVQEPTREQPKSSEAMAPAAETPKAEIPKLRAGKSEDELLQGENAPFNLVSETAADKATRLKLEQADEAAKAAKEAAEAKALQHKQQGSLFDSPEQKSIADAVPKKAVTIEEAQGVVDQLRAKFKGAADTQVVADGSELPEPVLAEARRLGVEPNRIGGVYHDGKVWINAGGIESPARAAEIFFHEQAGHHGVSKVMEGIRPGSEKGLARVLAQSFPEEWKHVTTRYEAARHVDEALARIMEKFGPRESMDGRTRTRWQRVVDYIRTVLAKAGIKTWKTADVESLLHRGLARIRAGAEAGGEGTKFAAEKEQRVTPEQDAAYKKAAESGDIETAQQLVDAAAKAAGYRMETWRGEQSGDEHTDFSGRREPAIFTSQNKAFAEEYTNGKGEPRRFYVKADKVLDLANPGLDEYRWMDKWGKEYADDGGWRDPQSGEETSASDVIAGGGLFDYEGNWSSRRWKDLQREAKAQGYDVLIAPDKGGGTQDESISTIVLNDGHIKLADPITKDDQGRIIPLSERFNPKSSDIRFAITGEEPEVKRLISDMGKPVLREAGAAYDGALEQGPEAAVQAAVESLRGKPGFDESLARNVFRAMADLQEAPREAPPKEAPAPEGPPPLPPKEAPPAAPAGDEPPISPRTAGIAHAVSEAKGIEAERGVKLPAANSVEQGRQELAALKARGGHPQEIIDAFSADHAISAKAMRVVRAHEEELVRAVANAAETHGEKSQEFKDAVKADQDWIAKVKPMQTEWSNTGEAQQGRVEIPNNTFYGYQHNFFERNGREMTSKEKEEARVHVEKIKQLESENAELQAKLDAAIAGKKPGKPTPEKPAITIPFKKTLEEMGRKLRETAKSSKSAAEVLKSEVSGRVEKLRSMLGAKFSVEGEAPQKNAAAPLDPEVMGELAGIGAAHLAEGAKTFPKWTEKMRAELGDDIFNRVKDHLPEIFEGSKLHKQAVERFVQKAQRAKAAETPEAMAEKAKAAAGNEEELTHRLVYDTARSHINAGVHGEDAVMAATTETLRENGYPDLTEREVRQAFSEYGKMTFPSKEADKVELAKIRNLTRMQESIDRLKEGEPALRTGLQRAKWDLEVRERQQQLNDAIKEFAGSHPPSPEQLATREQAKIRALDNAIEQLNEELKTGKKTDRPGPQPDSPEAEQKRNELVAMRELKRKIEGSTKPKKTEAEKQIETLQRARQNLDDILAGKKPENAPKEWTPLSATAESIKAELIAMHELVAQMKRDAKPPGDPGAKAEQAQIRALEKAIERYRDKTERSDFGTKGKKAGPESARVAQLKEILASRKSMYAIAKDKATGRLPTDPVSLRAHFAGRMKAGKLDGKFTPEEIKAIWNRAKVYIDANGSRDFPKMASGVAADLGLTPDMVKEALSQNQTVRKITNEMYRKQYEVRRTKQAAQMAIDTANSPALARALKRITNYPRAIAVLGHANAMITHAGQNAFRPLAWSEWGRNMGRNYRFLFSPKAHEAMMQALESHPDYNLALKSGLRVAPGMIEDYAAYGKFLGKVGEAGNRAMDSLKTFRMDYFSSELNRFPPELREKVAPMLANYVNHISGFGRLGGKRGLGTFGEVVREASFAPSLEASRWANVVGDPIEYGNIARRMITGDKTVTSEERAMLKFYISRTAQLAATYMGALAANYGLQAATDQKDKANFVDPTRSDWMKFKWNGHTYDPTGGLSGPLRLLANLFMDVNPKHKNFQGQSGLTAAAHDVLFYSRGKLDPKWGMVADALDRQNIVGRPMPFSEKRGTYAHPKLTWAEYAWSHAPIPVAEGMREVYDSLHDNGLGRPTSAMVASGVLAFAIGAFGVKEGRTPKKFRQGEKD